MATVPKRRAGKRAPKPAPEPEPEATEEEVLEDEEGDGEETPTKKRDTTPLPSGEELYNAEYVDGLTWQEIRDTLDPRIRSPMGLSIIAAYVIDEGLEDEHPEFSSLAELEGDELAEAIVEAHDNGQGWAVLAARCDLKLGEVQDIYADAGGENPGRVGGQRYGGGRSTGKEATEEEAADDQADSVEEEELVETPKPSAKRRAGKPKPKAKPAPAQAQAATEEPEPATAKKPPARRRRQAAATPS